MLGLTGNTVSDEFQRSTEIESLQQFHMVNLLTLFIENIQQTISHEFRKAVKLAFKLNGIETDNIPTLEWEKVQPLSWDDFTKGWQRLLQAGGVTPTEDLEAYFRTTGEAPKADYRTWFYN